MQPEKKYTHIVRSLNLAGLLAITWHESEEQAAKEQIHRRDECKHQQVVIMPVATEVIDLPSRGQVYAYRAPEEATAHRTRKREERVQA